MTITTTWKLNADVQAQYTAPDGTAFSNVVTSVHWRCIATDSMSGETESIYGEKSVPMPTDAASYIDLSTIQNMTDADKRATVLGWAEAIEPGFVAEKEAIATSTLESKLTAPETSTAAIL